MSMRSLLRALSVRKATTFTRKPRRFRPTLELLEGRLAPATFTVVNTNDAGAGSLRQAVLDANADAAADMIQFNIPAGATIKLTSGELSITKPVAIVGP